MESFPEALEGIFQLKRTARKSTFVSKKMVPIPTDSIPSASAFSVNGSSIASVRSSLDKSLKVNDNNLSDSDSNCNSSTTFVSEILEAAQTPEKFVSVEEMQTARILRLQTARKSFQSEHSSSPSPTKSDKGHSNRNGYGISSSSSSSSSFVSASVNTSHQGTPEHSDFPTKAKPRIRKFQKSLRDVPNNSADMKIPIVTLECNVTRSFATPRTLNFGDLESAESCRELSTTVTSNDEEIATPVARSSDYSQRGLKNKLQSLIVNVRERELEEQNRSAGVDFSSLSRLNHSDDFSMERFESMEYENPTLDCSKGLEDLHMEGLSHNPNKNFGNDDSNRDCRSSLDTVKEMFIERGLNISNLVPKYGRRRGRKRKRRFYRRKVYEQMRPSVDMARVFTEVLLENEERSSMLAPAELNSAVYVANLAPSHSQAASNPIGSKLSLLQHLPNIDVIDDVEFLSFETEDDLQRFVKRHPSYTLDFTGKNGVIRLRGEPIHLTKTTDVTKIKGWRNKIFASDVNGAAATNSDVDSSQLKQFLLNPGNANKPQNASREPHGPHFESEVDDNADRNSEEPLDLDIDVYDDYSQNDSYNDVVEDEDNEKSESEFMVTSSTSKVYEENEMALLLDQEPGDSLNSNAANESQINLGEKCNKSAFISDYLDDFLRNKSELKTSLSLNKVDVPDSEKIDTKVVWPKQGGAPSSEGARIKPPPFPTRKAANKFYLPQNYQTEKTVNSNLDAAPILQVIPKNRVLGEKHDSSQNLSKDMGVSCSLWKLSTITLTDAIYAANALVTCSKPKVPKLKIATVRKAEHLSLASTVDLDNKTTTPMTSYQNEVKKEGGVGNFLVTVTGQLAVMAASAYYRSDKTSKRVRENMILSRIVKQSVKPVVASGVVKVTSKVVEEKSPKVELNSQDARPPSPYSLDLPAIEMKSSCGKLFCQLGCVCESLKVPKRKRRHCGKAVCMLDCTCKAEEKAGVEPPARNKRPIRLPARLKDSFLWNGGRDLPLNIDWDMSVHRKSELRDDTTRLLWKESAKWGVPIARKRRGVSRGINRPAKLMRVQHNRQFPTRRDLTKGLRRGTINMNPYGKMTKFVSKTYGLGDESRTLDRKAHPTTSTQSYSQKLYSATDSVMSSRAKFESVLNKQLSDRQSCVVNIKRLLNQNGEWKVVHPNIFEGAPTFDGQLDRVDGLKCDEPNLMLPHDWRFVTKPPEANPECQKRMRMSDSSSIHSSKSSYKGKERDHKKIEMKLALRRLAGLVEPMVSKMKAETEGLDTKACIIDVATLHIKRLKQQEMEFLLTKSSLISRRKNLFQKYTTFLRDVELEQQKSSIKDLARRLQSCCMGRIAKRKVHKRRTSNDVSQHSGFDRSFAERGSELEDNFSENMLEEPRVVIENDLDDDEVDSTIFDISSGGNNSVLLNENVLKSRSLTITSASTSKQHDNFRDVKSKVLPSVRRWKKLQPEITNPAVKSVAEAIDEAPVATKRVLSDLESLFCIGDENNSSRIDGANTDDAVQDTPCNAFEFVAQDSNKGKKITFKFPNSISVRQLLQIQRVPNGDSGPGTVNEAQLQLPDESLSSPEIQPNQEPVAKRVVKEARKQSPRYVLYPVNSKFVQNGMNRGVPIFPKHVNLQHGNSSTVVQTPINISQPAAVGNTNGRFATILIPMSVLPAPNITGAAVCGVNTYGSNPGSSGIVPTQTLSAPTNGDNGAAPAADGNGEVLSNVDRLKIATSKVRLAFSNLNMMGRLRQLKPKPDAKDSTSILANEGSAAPNVNVDCQLIVNSNLDTVGTTNKCAPRIMVVRSQLPSPPIKNGQAPKTVEIDDSNLEEMENEHCDMLDDSVDTIEELPKIVGFSSISEDEFRLKDESVESLS